MIKRIIILFIILTSLGLFNFSFLGKDIIKVAEIAGIGVTLIVIFLQMVYDKKDGFKLTFRWEITFIILSVLLSMFMAYSIYNQSFTTTLIAQRFMYFYFVYFALHQIRISDADLEKIIVYLAIVYVIFYMAQFIAYPKILFNVRVIEERGTIRIFQAGLSYLILAYFLLLNRIFDEFSPGRIALLLVFFGVFILMGTRQLMFTMLLLTMIYILMSKKVKSRILVILLAILAIIPVFFMFQDIFSNIINLSQEQSVGYEENIRILSATFFLTDFFPNNLAYIIGNGADSSNSSYGMMIQMYKDAFGFYQSDVGIIGDYSRFGAIFLIAVIVIIYKVFRSKIGNELDYIKYFYLTVLLTSFTGGGFFGEANSIVAICITLYLIDVYTYNQAIDDSDAYALKTAEIIDEDEASNTRIEIDKYD